MPDDFDEIERQFAATTTAPAAAPADDFDAIEAQFAAPKSAAPESSAPVDTAPSPEVKDELLRAFGKTEALRPEPRNEFDHRPLEWEARGGPQRRDKAFAELFPGVRTAKDADAALGSAKSQIARGVYAQRQYPDLDPKDAAQLVPSDLFTREGAEKYLETVDAEEVARFKERAGMLSFGEAWAGKQLAQFGHSEAQMLEPEIDERVRQAGIPGQLAMGATELAKALPPVGLASKGIKAAGMAAAAKAGLMADKLARAGVIIDRLAPALAYGGYSAATAEGTPEERLAAFVQGAGMVGAGNEVSGLLREAMAKYPQIVRNMMAEAAANYLTSASGQGTFTDAILGAAMGATLGNTPLSQTESTPTALRNVDARYAQGAADVRNQAEVEGGLGRAAEHRAAMEEGYTPDGEAVRAPEPPRAPETAPTPEAAPESIRVEPEAVRPEETVSPEPTPTAPDVPRAVEAETTPAPDAPPVPEAAPVETTPAEGPEFVTSIKNRVVNRERVERGLGEMEEPIRQTWGEVTDKAIDIVAENPQRPHELVAELVANPRPHTATEGAILAIHRVNLHKARAAADAEGIKAAERGDLDAVAEAQARATQANDQFLVLEDATKRSGTETGRALAFRRAELAQDYSLIAMETRRRAENGYKPLTDAQKAETKALHDRLATAIAERDAYHARIVEIESRRGLGRAAKPVKVTAIESPEYGRANTVVTREAYEATLAAMKSKLTRLTAGIDPTLLADLAKVGAFHIEAGSRSFAKWAQAMVNDLGDKVTPHLRAVWDESRKQLGGEARSLKALKTRLRGVTEDLEVRTKLGVLEPPTRKPVPRDAEAVRLEANMEVAKKAWHEALMRDRLKNRSVIEKAATAVFQEIPNTARALMTSMDFSAVLRQGGFIALGHPVRAIKAMGSMFQAYRSKDAQARAEAELTLRPNYHLAKQSGLFLSEHGPATMTKMEEAYMSRWSEHVPLVAASQRAYITFLNRLRMDSFDAMLANLSRDATPTPKEARAVANYINVATGRGGGRESQFVAGLNSIFFSPRLVLSRFQMLAGQPMYRGSARTRSMVAKEYARFLAGVGVIYGLGTLAGGEVEHDPRSSDFGKVKFGPSRLDPLTGLGQATVLLSRVATGETKSLSGRITPLRGDNSRANRDAASVIMRFARTKLAPIPAAAFDVSSGRDVVGAPATAKSEALGLITPMSFKDIYDAMVAQGVPAGAAMGLLSIFGMSLQNHKDMPYARSN